jgi:competence protein ComEC
MYPLTQLAAAFCAGIYFESKLDLDAGFLISLVVANAVIAAAVRGCRFAALFVLAAFLGLGAWCLSVEVHDTSPNRLKSLIDNGQIPSGSAVELTGRMIAPAEPTADGTIITIDSETVAYRGDVRPVKGRVRLYLLLNDNLAAAEFEALDLKYGSVISAGCVLFREEQYQNPGVPSHLEQLDRQSIDATATLKSPLLIENIGRATVFLPMEWAYGLRQKLLDQFKKHLSPSTAGVLAASMLGDKYFLDKPTAEIFRQGGTFHVLVISGLHITFIGGMLLLVISPLVPRGIWKAFTVTAVLWAYTLAVGADPPVVRASLMFSILMFSYVVGRQRNLLNSLGACILILLAWRPSDLFNPSLQLTLLSVIAIVTIGFPLIEKLRSIGGWMPTAATPFPPNVPRHLVRFCETLYWNPAAWRLESGRQIWTAQIKKQPWLEGLFTETVRKTTAYIFEGLLVSVIVQACLLPLSIVYFHRVTPISMIMNLWVGAVIALESFTALIAVGLASMSDFLAAPFFSFTEFFNYLLVTAPQQFSASGWSSWRVPNYFGWASIIYAVYYVPVTVIAGIVWKWKPFDLSPTSRAITFVGLGFNRSQIAAAALAAAFFLILTIAYHPWSAPVSDGRLHIDFLDVGQGDSALVTFPDGTTMLIDGGGRLEYRSNDDDNESFVPDIPGIGEAVVSPVLWNKGYSRIDHIVATHADADHIQGLADIAENFQVGEALFGRTPLDDPGFAQLAGVLANHNIKIETISRGRILKFGGAVVEVLYPAADPTGQAPSDNDHSVVVRIVYGSRAFLLTGDIEQGAENELVNGRGVLRADIIKVAHHGSRTSSTQEFINAVDPQYAVISVGRRSRFGHPHKEVVDRWLASGSNVMTTGERGMISVSTDGKDLMVHPFLSQ